VKFGVTLDFRFIPFLNSLLLQLCQGQSARGTDEFMKVYEIFFPIVKYKRKAITLNKDKKIRERKEMWDTITASDL